MGISSRYKLISAHADYRRSDFIFPRTQSSVLRDAPWERRLRPAYTWSEIGVYGVSAVTTAALLASVLF
ncbi:MAG: hypothetical protein JSR60_06775 [Proteobacteria bacterium]|nr:hypothetical protein [Pseudomonadota bacterium]